MLLRHWEPHRWKPALQVKSQLVPVQLGVAFGGVVHGAQVPPHERWPGAQVVTHLVPSQVEAPLGTPGQASHEAPQLAALVEETQLCPQRC